MNKICKNECAGWRSAADTVLYVVCLGIDVQRVEFWQDRNTIETE